MKSRNFENPDNQFQPDLIRMMYGFDKTRRTLSEIPDRFGWWFLVAVCLLQSIFIVWLSAENMVASVFAGLLTAALLFLVLCRRIRDIDAQEKDVRNLEMLHRAYGMLPIRTRTFLGENLRQRAEDEQYKEALQYALSIVDSVLEACEKEGLKIQDPILYAELHLAMAEWQAKIACNARWQRVRAREMSFALSYMVAMNAFPEGKPA